MPGKPKNKDLIKLGRVPAMILDLTGVYRGRATVYNWSKKGRINQNGQRVTLKTYKRLGQLYTTKQNVIDFIRDLD